MIKSWNRSLSAGLSELKRACSWFCTIHAFHFCHREEIIKHQHMLRNVAWLKIVCLTRLCFHRLNLSVGWLVCSQCHTKKKTLNGWPLKLNPFIWVQIRIRDISKILWIRHIQCFHRDQHWNRNYCVHSLSSDVFVPTRPPLQCWVRRRRWWSAILSLIQQNSHTATATPATEGGEDIRLDETQLIGKHFGRRTDQGVNIYLSDSLRLNAQSYVIFGK